MSKKTKAERIAEAEALEKELNEQFQSTKYEQLLNVLKKLTGEYKHLFKRFSITNTECDEPLLVIERRNDYGDSCDDWFIDNREEFESLKRFVDSAIENYIQKVEKEKEIASRKSNAMIKLRQNFSKEELELLGIKL